MENLLSNFESVVAFGGRDYGEVLGVIRKTSSGWVAESPLSESKIVWDDWPRAAQWLRKKCGPLARVCRIHRLEEPIEYAQRMAESKNISR